MGLEGLVLGLRINLASNPVCFVILNKLNLIFFYETGLMLQRCKDYMRYMYSGK